MNYHYSLKPRSFLAAIASIAFACVPTTNAAIIFQADFNGPGAGTGGSNNVVSIGGTGHLLTGSAMNVAVTNLNPFTSLSGNHLNFNAVTFPNTSGSNGSPVTFLFSTISNSFRAWQGPNIAAADMNCVNLRGAFDCFFRKNSNTGGSYGTLMRPIDLTARTSWGTPALGTNFLQVLLTGNGNNYAPTLTVAAPAALTNQDGSTINFITNMVSGGFPGTGTSFTPSQRTILVFTAQDAMTNGTIYHLGIAFETDTNGVITFTTYRRVGTGPIDTKADVQGRVQFRLNADTYGPISDPGSNAFLFAQYCLNPMSFSAGSSFDMDYDTVRIYDSIPKVFEGLPGTPVLPPQSGLMFQADFNGSDPGTGGGTDLVTLGGTGIPNNDSFVTDPNVEAIVTADNQFGTTGGSYLNVAVIAGHGTQDSPAVRYFNFATNANSFQSWQGPDVLGAGTNYTRVHAGCDLFFRANYFDEAIVGGDTGWFRPLWMTANSLSGGRPVPTVGYGGGGNLTVRFAGGGGNNGIFVTLIGNHWLNETNDPPVFLDFTSTVGTVEVNTNNQIQIRGGDVVSAGTNVVHHAGFTLNTDSSGLTTLNVYLQQGTNAIDLTAPGALVASATFRINAAAVGPDAFYNVPWNFNPNWGASANGANFDMDSVRLYEAVPTSFRSLGAPLPPPLPGVASVLPAGGITNGGTVVTINGVNFVSGMTVKFGTNSATGVNFVNSTQATAVAPAGTLGKVDVTIQNPDGSVGSLFNGYTYSVPPNVVSLSPASGSTTGGTTVNISGSNFVSGSTVKFGGNSAYTVIFQDAALLTVVTPAGSPGAVSVIVENPYGQTGTLPNGFTYNNTAPPGFLPPTISGGNITLTWTNTGTLLWATNVLGPWLTNASATSPYSEPVVLSENRFYRLLAP